MEFLNIIGSISIKPDWANITGAVLKAGTPLSITGVVANNANAIGLLAQEAHKGDSEVNVVYAGLVDIGEVGASYGDLTDDCVAALKGITFVSASGAATISSGLPDYSEASDGDVLSIDNGAPAWKEPSGGGGDGGVFVVGMDMQTGALDKTWQQIYDAMKNGGMALLVAEMAAGGVGELYCMPFVGAGYRNEDYTVQGFSPAGVLTFKTTSADGYPVQQQS